MTTKKTTAKQARKNAKARATKPAKKQTPGKKATAKNRVAPTALLAQSGGVPTKKLSQFQAAIQVLADAGEPMNCKAMVEAMNAKGLWTSPTGKTPDATLYASILRDIRKGKDATFAKADRGLFTLAGKK